MTMVPSANNIGFDLEFILRGWSFIYIMNNTDSKGNKTVPGEVATTHTEDVYKQNTKTSATI
jgi:hypothetical protein